MSVGSKWQTETGMVEKRKEKRRVIFWLLKYFSASPSLVAHSGEQSFKYHPFRAIPKGIGREKFKLYEQRRKS